MRLTTKTISPVVPSPFIYICSVAMWLYENVTRLPGHTSMRALSDWTRLLKLAQNVVYNRRGRYM